MLAVMSMRAVMTTVWMLVMIMMAWCRCHEIHWWCTEFLRRILRHWYRIITWCCCNEWKDQNTNCSLHVSSAHFSGTKRILLSCCSCWLSLLLCLCVSVLLSPLPVHVPDFYTQIQLEGNRLFCCMFLLANELCMSSMLRWRKLSVNRNLIPWISLSEYWFANEVSLGSFHLVNTSHLTFHWEGVKTWKWTLSHTH